MPSQAGATVTIERAKDNSAIAAAFPVMHELRPHLADSAEFVARVARQMQDGYRLVVLKEGPYPVACAGYRVQEMLSRGRFLYVDDLVTTADARSRGYGDKLMDWLVDEARALGCERLHLDSGVQRADAHRFYFRRRLTISAFHFGIEV
ncbi:MAG TPA: GNAT family N-acetyltransferase [Alphaproteobacteria bacterium]|nr:GNAT family N-acetyltransferase [Alphaproteobacteria bacterium]